MQNRMNLSNDNPVKPELKFEQAFKRLEEIVAQLESNELPLEDALDVYEEGIGLARYCMDRLNAAELRVRELTLD